METEDEFRAVGELAAMFINLGKAIAAGGLPFIDGLYAVLVRAAGKDTVDMLLGAMNEHHIPAWPALTEESFDSCICGAPMINNCIADDAHDPTCPVKTDVWPVTPLDIAGELCCSACSAPFNLAEFYVSIPEIMCLGCAALRQLA